MTKKRIALVLLLVAMIATITAYRRVSARSSPAIGYETAKVSRGRIVAKVSATGTLSALVTVQVGAQVSGRLKHIYVDYNAPVKKGQVIAKLDPQMFQAAVEQARANYEAAQSSVKKAIIEAEEAERKFQRSKALSERKLIAEADLDAALVVRDVAKAEVDAASSNLNQARAALHQAEVNLGYATIVSPIDGIVVSRSVDVGQTVAASLQAPTLFVIAEDLRKMQVDTSVAESDVGKLAPGMAAIFTVDAYPGERFKGTVRQIRNAPQTVQNIVTYDTVIDLENPHLRLKPGMTANVTVVVAEARDVIRIPNAALRFLPSAELLRHAQKTTMRTPFDEVSDDSPFGTNASRTVWILRNTVPVPVTISTGISDGVLTALVAGEVQDGNDLITETLAATTSPASMPPPPPPF